MKQKVNRVLSLVLAIVMTLGIMAAMPPAVKAASAAGIDIINTLYRLNDYNMEFLELVFAA